MKPYVLIVHVVKASKMSITYDLDDLLKEMDLNENTNIQVELSTGDDQPLNVPLTVFRLIVCVVGILGNLLVIFVILVLAEYRKSVTHWYVLQLAIADSIFLLTIPFRVVEDIENGWNFSVWMCKAKETILFLNYYSSISFLVVMSVDRYIAVCHGFSSSLQKFRTPLTAGIVTIAVWGICLLICIPIMMYSTPRGHRPNCRCEYIFPKPFNATETCLTEGETNGIALANCIAHLNDMPEEACTDRTTLTLPGSGFGFSSDYDLSDFLGWGAQETTASPEGMEVEGTVFLKPGCHYFDYAVGFKSFIWFNFVVMFLIPLIIMTVCYVLIIRRLYATRFRSDGIAVTDSKGVGSRPSSVSSAGKKRTRSSSSAKHNRNRIRVTIMCASMVILFFVCWLPFHSVHLAKFAGIKGTSDFCLNLFYAVSLIAFSNSAINPYLYNFIGTRFGKRLSSAASTIRESVKKRTSTLSGTVQYHYRKRTTENGTSNSQTATVTTKIYKGKIEPTSGEISSHVFYDTNKPNDEEQRRLTTVRKLAPEEDALSPLSQDLPPDYVNYKKQSSSEFVTRI